MDDKYNIAIVNVSENIKSLKDFTNELSIRLTNAIQEILLEDLDLDIGNTENEIMKYINKHINDVGNIQPYSIEHYDKDIYDEWGTDGGTVFIEVLKRVKGPKRTESFIWG